MLAYLDGEIEAEREAEIERMLEADWDLRADLSRLERRIEKFIEVTAYQSPAAIPPVDDLWQDFTDRRCGQAPEMPPQPEMGSNLFSAFERPSNFLERLPIGWTLAFRWSSRLAAAAFVGLTVTAIVFFLLRTEQLVSAEELLRRAVQAESDHMGQVTDPVVYRKLQLRRRMSGHEDSVTWESWKDVASDRFKQRVAEDHKARFSNLGEKFASEMLAELEHVFQANYLDARRPLSVTDYEAWRKTVRKKSESVSRVTLPGSQEGLKLTTTAEGPYAANAITEASLVVRWSNWHAVTQQLKVHTDGDIREYELSEMAYDVVPLQSLNIFTEMASNPSSAPVRLPTPVHVSPAMPNASLPTEGALRDAEVAALYALHQQQADLGGQIEVVREASGQVIARGLVETAERKRQLTEALGRLPLVNPQLQTYDEAAQRKAAPRSSAVNAAPGGDTVIAASGVSAFQQRLARYFVERDESSPQIPQRVAQLSTAVVSSSNSALSEAWALRRLATRVAAWSDDELPPDAKQRIREMKRNHLTRLKSYCRSLRTQLEPALTAIAGERAAGAKLPAESSPQAQAMLVFKSVEHVYQLTHKLFAGTGIPSETPEQSARQLLNALAGMDGTLDF
ncbi:MAG TPA: hypothetical protein VJ302_36770 [Blastocatellia bacterium]|nr:hypothetical protein [Blastocatellia bacterium]